MQKYDIFDNNCNHFSNFCSEVLVGNGIPNDILNQANEFKNTPIGQMLQGFQVNPNNNTQSYDLTSPFAQNNSNGGTGSQTGITVGNAQTLNSSGKNNFSILKIFIKFEFNNKKGKIF